MLDSSSIIGDTITFGPKILDIPENLVRTRVRVEG
jgi:hypothetical protein